MNPIPYRGRHAALIAMTLVLVMTRVEAQPATPRIAQEKAAMSRVSSKALDARTLTRAPLRTRLRVALNAPTSEVWALLGDLSRFPEYSAGLERVEWVKDKSGQPTGYICHFRPPQPGAEGFSDGNQLRWYEAPRGYASSSYANNSFGLRDDLYEVTLAASKDGTLVTFDFYFNADDVAAQRAGLDQANADIGQRLVARFGGQVLERTTDAPVQSK